MFSTNSIARLRVPRTWHVRMAQSASHNVLHRAALIRSLSSKPPDDDAPSENSILPENPIPLSESSSTCLEKSPTEAPSIHLEPIVSLEDPSSTFSLESLDTGYPNLMTPDPFIDTHDAEIYPPDKNSPYLNKVVVRNDPSFFLDSAKGDSSSQSDAQVETEDEISPLSNLPLNAFQINKLFRFPIMTRRITQQTGKGKIHRMYTMVVVGNGNGLVGYGEGKDDEAARASEKAFAQAVRNMDWVERFEKRTIWTEMDTKLGATRLILRPRPVGFGLRCNPNIHQVLKAAGIKDISAKVWGSRNPLNVVKALFRMLQAGNAPLSMGDGIGGGGRKLNKGSGLRSKSEVERERGRKLIDLRD